MKGDAHILPSLRLGQQMPLAEFIKQLGRAPPMAVLKLCFGIGQYNFLESMLQHADDLDFVQDVLCASGDSLEVNPILNGVLAGFNRRRRYNRFKYGHHTMELDRLRFEHTISEKDSDLQATEVSGLDKTEKRSRNRDTRFMTVCSFYQQAGGCTAKECRYTHKCAVCHKLGHGAVNCYQRRYSRRPENNNNREQNRRTEAKSETDRPPNPRFRRARANNTE